MDELDPRERSARNLCHVTYGLYGLSLFIGLSAVVAIIVNYVKRDDVAGTLAESHFRWQVRTFWYAILWLVLGGITAVVGVGFVVLVAALVWFVYRLVKGWLYLNDGKPMYLPAAR